MKFVTLTTGLIVLLSVSGCVNRGAQDQARQTQEILQDQTKLVSVEEIQRRPISETIEITGDLVSSDDSQIGPKSPGKLVALYVREGDFVQAGQLIGRMDSTQQQSTVSSALAGLATSRSQLSQARANQAQGPLRSSAAVRQAAANVQSARAQLARAIAGARPQERQQAENAVRQAKSVVDTAKADFDRVTQLFAEGAVSKQRLEQSQNAYISASTQYNSSLQSLSLVKEGTRPEDIEVARQGLRQAEEGLRSAQASKSLDVTFTDQVGSAMASVQAAQAQLSIAKQALADTEIRAPFSGEVAGKPTQIGTVLGSGTPIIRLINSNGIYFQGQIPEEVVSLVAPGQKVELDVTALPGRKFSGQITALNPQGIEAGRLFTARIQISNPVGLKSGMFTRGIATLRTIPDAITVPQNAIVQFNGESVVFVVVGTKAKATKVKTLLKQGDRVQVEGVEAGAKVVVSGQGGLIDGSPVRTSEPTAPKTQPTPESAGARK